MKALLFITIGSLLVLAVPALAQEWNGPDFEDRFSALCHQSNYKDAITTAEQALQTLEKLGKRDGYPYSVYTGVLAELYYTAGDLKKAKALSTTSQKLMDAHYVRNEEEFLMYHSAEVATVMADGCMDESSYMLILPYQRWEARQAQKEFGKDHPEFAAKLAALAETYSREGFHQRALSIFGKAAGIYRKANDEDCLEMAYIWYKMAEVYREREDDEKAETLLKRAIGAYEKHDLEDNTGARVDLGLARHLLVDIYREADRDEEAEGVLAPYRVPVDPADRKESEERHCRGCRVVLEGAVDMYEMDHDAAIFADGEITPDNQSGRLLQGKYIKSIPVCRGGGTFFFDSLKHEVYCSVHRPLSRTGEERSVLLKKALEQARATDVSLDVSGGILTISYRQPDGGKARDMKDLFLKSLSLGTRQFGASEGTVTGITVKAGGRRDNYAFTATVKLDDIVTNSDDDSLYRLIQGEIKGPVRGKPVWFYETCEWPDGVPLWWAAADGSADIGNHFFTIYDAISQAGAWPVFIDFHDTENDIVIAFTQPDGCTPGQRNGLITDALDLCRGRFDEVAGSLKNIRVTVFGDVEEVYRVVMSYSDIKSYNQPGEIAQNLAVARETLSFNDFTRLEISPAEEITIPDTFTPFTVCGITADGEREPLSSYWVRWELAPATLGEVSVDGTVGYDVTGKGTVTVSSPDGRLRDRAVIIIKDSLE